MISLSECAPCKAKRLQEESEREFRQRYGMVDLNRKPLRMGWKPFLGQAVSPVSAATSSSPGLREYLFNSTERFVQFGFGAATGIPIGIFVNLILPKWRPTREEAALMAVMAAGLGLAVTLLPFPESSLASAVSKWSGVFTGFAFADMILPKRAPADLVAAAPK